MSDKEFGNRFQQDILLVPVVQLGPFGPALDLLYGYLAGMKGGGFSELILGGDQF